MEEFLTQSKQFNDGLLIHGQQQLIENLEERIKQTKNKSQKYESIFEECKKRVLGEYKKAIGQIEEGYTRRFTSWPIQVTKQER